MSRRIELNGTLTPERGEIHRTIRSSFVFRKLKVRRQIVNQRSSVLPVTVD